METLHQGFCDTGGNQNVAGVRVLFTGQPDFFFRVVYEVATAAPDQG